MNDQNDVICDNYCIDDKKDMTCHECSNFHPVATSSTQDSLNISRDEVIASNQNQINHVELDPVTEAIPGQAPLRDPRIDSQRTEFQDVTTMIRSRVVYSDKRMLTQDEIVPAIQQNNGMHTHPGSQNSHPLIKVIGPSCQTDSSLDDDFVLKGGALTVINKKRHSLNCIETWTLPL
ncbi:unnamed protein product [Mytilus coruscus]|uniref:Uncharacterized protein n=1 Tax=Mytilus coruscus TaxID=42192 RepID=A0A6J8A323_MYTCO|nr:unnamed protein product [Mytilus coruscus]